jgi:hypothetical protein
MPVVGMQRESKERTVTQFLGAYKRLRRLVGPSVGLSVRWSVRPHDAITWKTSYVAIASRRGRGKLVKSLFLRVYGLGDPLVFLI